MHEAASLSSGSGLVFSQKSQEKLLAGVNLRITIFIGERQLIA